MERASPRSLHSDMSPTCASGEGLCSKLHLLQPLDTSSYRTSESSKPSRFPTVSRLDQLSHYVARVDPERVCDVDEFDDVDAALSGFDVGDERLVAAELGGELALLQAGLLAVGGEELGQSLVAG